MSRGGEFVLLHAVVLIFAYQTRRVFWGNYTDQLYDFYDVPFFRRLFLPGPLRDRRTFRKYIQVLTVAGGVVLAIIYGTIILRWVKG